MGTECVLVLATMHRMCLRGQWRCDSRMLLGDRSLTPGSDARSTTSDIYCRGREEGEPNADALSNTATSDQRFWYVRKSLDRDSWNWTFSTSFLI